MSLLIAMKAPGPGGHCSGWVTSCAAAPGMAGRVGSGSPPGPTPVRRTVVVEARVVPDTIIWNPRTRPSAAGFQ